jgi:hypothetical protein
METVNPDLFWIVIALLLLSSIVAHLTASHARRIAAEANKRIDLLNLALSEATEINGRGLGDMAEWAATDVRPTLEHLLKQEAGTRERLRNLEVAFHEAKTFDPMAVKPSGKKTQTKPKPDLKVVKNEDTKTDGKDPKA